MTTEGEDLRKWRLPRGRHGLPREMVVRSQRERLLAAVVRVTAAKGYEATSVADILEEAGVGRESFYELFDDKRDCILAAHAALVDHLEATVKAAYEEPGPWTERVRRSVGGDARVVRRRPRRRQGDRGRAGRRRLDLAAALPGGLPALHQAAGRGPRGRRGRADRRRPNWRSAPASPGSTRRSSAGAPPTCRRCCPNSPTSFSSPSSAKRRRGARSASPPRRSRPELRGAATSR